MKKSRNNTAFRLISLVMILTLIVSVLVVGVVPAGAHVAGDEIKGRTVAQVLGMDGAVYYRWMSSHENDKYYLTTPYAPYDRRNPNGDCAGANGASDVRGVPALNCMGFVWHALYMPTKMSGGRTGIIPAYARGGWYGLYTNNNVTRKYFGSKKAMLSSGYLEKGDIIWMYKYNEHTADDYNHIAIYWGDGHSDKVWHSVGAGCVFGKVRDYKLYCVLKVGAVPNLSTPKISSVKNTASGAKISWKKVTGAQKYRVFVKNGSKWERIGDTTSTSFVHKGRSGMKYTYTVRCINTLGTQYLSKYDKKGYTNTFYAAPGKLSADTQDGGILFTWKGAENVRRYRVYRRLSASDSWKAIANVDYQCSYFDTDVTYGKSYQYTARSVDANNQLISYYESPTVTQYLKKPKISSVTINNTGVVFKWNKISGAKLYRLFYKTDGSWQKAGDTTDTAFTFKNAPTGVEALYTVRCVTEDKTNYASAYDMNGTPVMYCETPQVNRLRANDDGLNVRWNAVEGTVMYRVFRKTEDTGYTPIATTEEISYSDPAAVPGTKYTYTVRCVDPETDKYISGFYSPGWSMFLAEQPTLEATISDNVVTLSWEPVAGAKRYRVFMKKGEDSEWESLLTTGLTGYQYFSAEKNVVYFFTIRSIDENGYYNSTYDQTGVSVICIGDPEEGADEDASSSVAEE